MRSAGANHAISSASRCAASASAQTIASVRRSCAQVHRELRQRKRVGGSGKRGGYDLPAGDRHARRERRQRRRVTTHATEAAGTGWSASMAAAVAAMVEAGDIRRACKRSLNYTRAVPWGDALPGWRAPMRVR